MIIIINFRFSKSRRRSRDFVCICRRVNERAVAAAIAEGANTPARQLAAACGAGTECGGCKPALKRLCEAARSTCNEGASERNVRT